MIFTWAGSGLGGANSALQKLNKNYIYEAISPFNGINEAAYRDCADSGSLQDAECV